MPLDATEPGAPMAIPPARDALRRIIQSLESAAQKNPESPSVAVKLAEAYLQGGEFGAGAMAVYERAVAIRPTDAHLQKAQSVSLLIQQIDDLVRSYSSDGAPTLSEAEQMLGSLLEEYPLSADLSKRLGDLKLLSKDYEAAQRAYEKALDLGYASVADILATFESVDKRAALPAQDVLYYARLQRLAGWSEREIALLERAVDQDAGREAEEALLDALGVERLSAEDIRDIRGESLERVLSIYLRSGRVEQAQSLLGRLDPLEPQNRGLFTRFARLLFTQGKALEAFELVKTMLLDPPTKDLLNEISLKLEQQGMYDEATAILRHINENDFVIQEATQIQERQLEIAAELELADLHLKNQRFGKALEKYVQALRMGPSQVDPILERIDAILDRGERADAAILFFLGRFFRERGNSFRALIYLNKALDLDPTNQEAIDGLERTYESLLKANPEQPELHLERGGLYLRIGRAEEAIADLIFAAATPEIATEANRRLLHAYMKTGQYRQALERANLVNLTTADLDLVYELEMHLEESGERTEALQALSLIHDVDPGYKDVAQKISSREEKGAAQSGWVDPQMKALIGDLATGRYRFMEKIGSGGMGVVYRVYDVKHKRPVAMKILREGLANNARALMRFIREAQYADQLNHPNIVHIYDFNISKVPGQSFITMEYVDGPSFREILEERIKGEKKVDEAYLVQIMNFCIQLCDALEATHKQGIIHRDIKPDNIMVNSAGEVKITDFGILHVEDGAATPTGALLGTPRYMSPEQVKGTKVDTRSDIYAVGILLFEMLTYAPPFISGDIAYQQVNVRPTPPREIISVIPPTLNQVIMTCLDKQPERRYQNARSLRNSLVEEQRGLGGAPPNDPAITTWVATPLDEAEFDRPH